MRALVRALWCSAGGMGLSITEAKICTSRQVTDSGANAAVLTARDGDMCHKMGINPNRCEQELSLRVTGDFLNTTRCV